MARTYEPIASQTLSSDTASVTFSDIPGTYTDLIIAAYIKHSFGTTGDVAFEGLQFNSDTGTNYSRTGLYGNGSSAVSDRLSSANGITLVGTRGSNSDFGVSLIQVMSYSNTNVNKTVLYANASSGTSVPAYRNVGLWRSTAAITSVTITATGAFTIKAGSTFSVYGIKAA